MKKVFLDDLPRKDGIGSLKGTQVIDWKNSVGYEVKFIYDTIEGRIKIIDYKNNYLYIKYLDKDSFKINTGGFQKCCIGKLLDEHTNEFKIEIGTHFKDEKRDLIIIDREYVKSKSGQILKYYTCLCNKCGYTNKVMEGNLIQKQRGCPACRKSPQVVVLGINTIWDTDRWMCDLGLSEEDAKTHAKCSNNKVHVTCPNCGKSKQIIISNLYKTYSIGCQCNDKKSYISKYMFNLLKQLEIDFEVEKKYSWCNFYNPFKQKNTYGIYDFVVEKEQIIIEADGGFHRKDNKMRNQTKEESIWLDNIKDELAQRHGYKVIRISDVGDIKQNILDSHLMELFNISNINWDLCTLNAMKNIVKEVCNYWNNKPHNMNAEQVGNIFKLSRPTIVKYLKQGEKFNWCKYNSNEEKTKGRLKGNKNRKEIEIFDLNNNKLGTFESATDLERQSEELFGTKLLHTGISKACHNKTPYKRYLFKYSHAEKKKTKSTKKTSTTKKKIAKQ